MIKSELSKSEVVNYASYIDLFVQAPPKPGPVPYDPWLGPPKLEPWQVPYRPPHLLPGGVSPYGPWNRPPFRYPLLDKTNDVIWENKYYG